MLKSPIPKISLVLTGTITPSIGICSPTALRERRQQYLAALKYYRQLKCEIFFLENSGFSFENDQEFRSLSGVQFRSFQPSAYPERGKGFQEFEMISRWLITETSPPPYWLKITGRYVIQNIRHIAAECTSFTRSLIIDQAPRSRTCRTYLFYISSQFFMQYLGEVYKECDDRESAWIEKVLFDHLRNISSPDIRFFRCRARMHAISGSSGRPYPNGFFESSGKQILRRINSLIDNRYLWFSN